MKQSGSRGGILGLREWLNFLWRLFGLIGAVLGLRRWWRTLTDREEQKSTRLLAGVLLVLMVALIVLSVVRPHGSVDGGTATATQTPTPRQMVVDFRDDVPLSTISRLGGELGVAFEPNSPLVDSDKVMLASVPSAAAGERLLARLRGDARVSAADHNDTYHLFGWQVRPRAARVARQVGPGMTPNDPRYAEQWNFPLIGMPAAWEKATGKGVVVAVIDTGCAFEREGDIPAASDLKQTKFTKPYDFVNHRKRAYDDHGHGTHVAGTIAQSTNNQHGVAGIAYEATIMPLKVLGAGGSGTVADIAEAIEYAANQGAHIINMSLGGPRGNAVMRRACTYANQRGVTIVCSAGNSGRQGVGYPAAYPECIAVSSVGPTGELAFYSSWGPEVALAAPGGDYRSEEERGNGVLQNTVFGKRDVFEFWQGTSMASPHVAGVAALIHQGGVHGPAAIRDRLRASATPKDDPARYGAGILNAAAAVGASRVAPPVAVPAPARPRAPLAPWLLLAAALLLVPPVAAPKPAP